MTTLQNFRNHGAQLLAIPQDDEGLSADVLEQRLRTLQANGERMPKLLFDVPDFHNPTGITMSLARRQALLALAVRYGFVIVEDDPYRRLRFEGTPVPPLKALDTHGVVIAAGTVSKILSPGLRIGWAIAAPEIVRRMALQKPDGGSCPFTQRIVVSLMRGNRMKQHVDELTAQMRAHRDAMIEALASEIPQARVRRPEGGYFLWAALPEGVSADAVVARGIRHQVEATSGRMCFPGADPGNYLRFAYSFAGEAEIREGIRRLGVAYREVAAAG